MEYKVINENNVRYIILPELEDLGLKHCFTTKDMNMSFINNSSTEEVINDHKIAFEFMNIDPIEVFSSVQKHTNNISIIKDMNQGRKYEIGRVLDNNDGFVTNLKNIALISKYADCTPIILYDPIKKVHANIHSGWKGTLKRIGACGVSAMINNYKSNPKDIIAVLGPNICKDDFEVDIDVKDLFQSEFDFSKDIIFQKDNIKYLIDLHETNKRILLKMGLKEENISIIDISTKSNPMLHSFRRDKHKFGLMGVVTCLNY
ncbi:polyphenol oxidase family protein [Wansuia hejianensis]|uniref:Polyphenol oxidase family protein n=1 Tax=Wansuia hejianensis TaxID=2763667 RepID=A0A926EZM4_9FIRM|nr:polyphenol oxidase family protein [Wansuia hejianensis]MBC8591308.1 polyphenol oxidase family protein [Wansuia hejianensis]